MIRLPPRSTLTATLFPTPPRFRAASAPAGSSGAVASGTGSLTAPHPQLGDYGADGALIGSLSRSVPGLFSPLGPDPNSLVGAGAQSLHLAPYTGRRQKDRKSTRLNSSH